MRDILHRAVPWFLLALAVVQNHAHARHPWPIVTDALDEIAVNRPLPERRHGNRGLGKLGKTALNKLDNRRKDNKNTSKSANPQSSKSADSRTPTRLSSNEKDRGSKGPNSGMTKAGKIGLGLGLPILMIGVGLAAFCIWTKKMRDREPADVEAGDA